MAKSGMQRLRLDRAAIVAAAVVLADERGVRSLTMRSLAASLGYEVMSLYNHIPNKNSLLAAMVDAAAEEIEAPAEDLTPLEQVRAIIVSTHDVLVAHPWATELWNRSLPGPARIGWMDDLLRHFEASGLSAELAHHGFHAVTNHVVGYTIQQLEFTDVDEFDDLAREFLAALPTEQFPHMAAHVQLHLDGESSTSFELVLDLILDGLVRLDEAD